MFKKINEKCKNLLILGRYNNPVGAFLLMWPCYWGVFYNEDVSWDVIRYLIYFSLGSFVMRGAGCCINDIFDKEYDKRIERTRNRPLASGSIKVSESIIFIFFQLLFGLIIILQFNKNVILLGFAIMPLVITYPLFKRFTYFPQFILGLAFNWGVLVGHMSQSEYFNFNILYLYLAGVFLTTAYDTVYGFQDLDEDKKLGLKSLAILFEKKRKKLLIIYILSSLFFSVFFFLNYSNVIFNFFCSLLISYSLISQFYSFRNGTKLISVFRSNVKIGGLVTILIIIQNYL